MCASIIIDTSFAPSPIANVIACSSSCLISLTTSAFYPGDTRQQITPSHDFAILRKYFLYSMFPKMMLKAVASTKSPLFY